jgi:hypothetical protein
MLDRRQGDSGAARAAAAFEPTVARTAASTVFGTPHDRATFGAAREAFLEMKQLFMRAAEQLGQGKGAWLRAQVRAAEEFADLSALRSALLAALGADDPRTRALRAELYKSLDNVFPAFALCALELDRLPPLPASWRGWRGSDTSSRPGSPSLR